MLTKVATLLSVAAVANGVVQALPVPTGAWPASTGVVQNAEYITVKAGEVFDGKMQTYERSDITCQGQKESSYKDAVFLVEPGATLKNVIIGKNQMEGVHCEKHDCTIENVWWDDVCEDALSIKGGSATSVSKVIGGGARYADDKVVQHNGLGLVSIDGFFAEDVGKLYRSCGTCGDKQRNVEVSNVYAKNPKASIVTVNSNFGDKATLSNIYIETTKKKVTVCGKSIGTADGSEPSKDGEGPDGTVCIFDDSDIHYSAPSGAAAGNSTTPEAPATTTEAPKPTEPATTTPVADDNDDDDGEEDASPAPVTMSPATSAPETKAPATAAPPPSSGSGSASAPAAGTVPTGEWPASKGVVQNAEPITVKAGEVFDGKMQTYERSDITCEGQKEGGAKQTVFMVEPGATLKNVIIGKNQIEGVYCPKHDCVIENVWWDDVCEDALSIKGGSATSVSKVIGGGARYADDKVIQHNGPGLVSINGFFAEDFGKLYRSCGTCGEVQRNVEVSNVYVKNPKVSVVTVNTNNGDTAKLSNIYVESSKSKVTVCGKSVATSGAEPAKDGEGPDGKTCIYEESDIHFTAPSGGSAATTPAPVAGDNDDEEYAPTPATPTPAPASSDSDAEDANNDDVEAPATTKPPKTKKPKKTKKAKKTKVPKTEAPETEEPETEEPAARKLRA